MTTRIEGFSVDDLKWRMFDGVFADLWSVRCAPHAGGDYVGRDPRVVVMLEAQGAGSLQFETGDQRGHRRSGNAMTVSYVPAGLPMRGHVAGLSRLRHLDLHLDTAALHRRFAGDLDPARLDVPRMMLDDERLAAIAGLIATDMAQGEPLTALYGESLVTALLAALFEVRPAATVRGGGLTERTRRKVCDYIEANAARTIRLEDLARIAGLSVSHFSHAFKASVGMAPHRWQLRARVRLAQDLLARSPTSLVDVAASTGFCDQAHFTRVFKSVVGVTPSVWMRGQRADG
ncbi:helix-turn-helix domain-containing protein [Methylobrevis pamukkalensis]|nr:AraC family transcriptional regulator [Methylobrevis pamukkalensis]